MSLKVLSWYCSQDVGMRLKHETGEFSGEFASSRAKDSVSFENQTLSNNFMRELSDCSATSHICNALHILRGSNQLCSVLHSFFFFCFILNILDNQELPENWEKLAWNTETQVNKKRGIRNNHNQFRIRKEKPSIINIIVRNIHWCMK